MPQFDALALHAATADSADIVQYIEQRAPLEIGRWDSIGQEEYARAFVVAGTAGQDVIADIYAAMLQTIREGGTEQDFAELITPVLRAKGWYPGPGQTIARRVQLIYDTNLRVARSIGRWQRIQAVATTMPYLLGQTVGDNRVRDEHTAFQGVCLPVNHWFWLEFFPPLYFRCRCDVLQLTRGQFARRGLVITSDEEAQSRAAIIRPQSWGNPALAPARDLDAVVANSNDRRLPGSPPLDGEELAAQGRSSWQGIMGLAIQQLVAGLAEAIGVR